MTYLGVKKWTNKGINACKKKIYILKIKYIIIIITKENKCNLIIWWYLSPGLKRGTSKRFVGKTYAIVLVIIKVIVT